VEQGANRPVLKNFKRQKNLVLFISRPAKKAKTLAARELFE
jgi:hypothetical protein